MLTSFFTGSSRFRARATRGVIGIDIGSHSVKAVQVEHDGAGGSRVVAALSRPRGAIGRFTESEAEDLYAALRAAGFVGDAAAISMPPADAVINTIELPPRSSNAPLDQLARMEMSRNCRTAPEAFELAWWEMPSGVRASRGTHAMAVAVPHAAANGLLDTVESAGFDAAGLDLEAASLARACESMLAATGITAILDLGHGPATLTLVNDGVITFHRRLPEVSAGDLSTSLCKRLAIEPDVAEYLLGEIGVGGGSRSPATGDESVELPDEGRRLLAGFVDLMCKELGVSFDYASHLYPDAPVGRLLLTGGAASIAGLSARLATSLGVEVKLATPAALTPCEPGLLSVCSSPALTLALGLALRDED